MHRPANIFLRVARQDGADQRVAIVCLEMQWDVASWYVALVVGGQQQVLAAVASDANIRERDLPSVHDRAVKAGSSDRRRQFDNYGSVVLCIGKVINLPS